MAQPLLLSELDAAGSLSAGAAVAVVQGNDTVRTTPAAFINDARSYTPAGAGGVAEPVEAALRRFVHTGQYSSQANYESARDALTGTIGVPSLQVTGSLSLAGSLVVEGATIPQISASDAYELVLSDANKHVLHPDTDANDRTFTIPANASVAFAIGTCVTFVNDAAANTVDIAITSDTLIDTDGNTGTRTLAANGVATAIKIGSTRWKIAGTGLS